MQLIVSRNTCKITLKQRRLARFLLFLLFLLRKFASASKIADGSAQLPALLKLTVMQISDLWLLSIVRDEQGFILAAATWKSHGSESAILAEAFALLTTMKFVVECVFRKIIFEGDNDRLVRMLNEKNGVVGG